MADQQLEATPKAPDIDLLLTSLTGRSRQDCVANHICMTCGGPAEQFSDQLSIKEFTISGMCQVCQDSVFAMPEDDDPTYL